MTECQTYRQLADFCFGFVFEFYTLVHRSNQVKENNEFNTKYLAH